MSNNKNTNIKNVSSVKNNIEDMNTYSLKYCDKCGRELESMVYAPFCSGSCRSEYYKEIAREMDSFGE